MFGFFKRKKKDELTASELEWKAAFESVLRELVPGEQFELIAIKGEGVETRFELVSDSKRALVAWAEIQEVIRPTAPGSGWKPQ